MNKKSLKAIIGVALTGSLIANATFAQSSPPDATVDGSGNLILNPGTAEEQTINPPAGVVLADGSLDIDNDGTADVTVPSATVLADGSLDLGGGTVLPVPDGPPGANPLIEWMNVGGHEVVQFNSDLSMDVTQYFWSYTFKTMYWDASAPAYIFIRELGAYFYFSQTSGTQSLDGVWAYGFNFPAGQQASGSGGTWTWFSVNNFPTRMATASAVMDGWLFLAGAPYANYYKVKEFDSNANPGTYLFGGDVNVRLTTVP